MNTEYIPFVLIARTAEEKTEPHSQFQDHPSKSVSATVHRFLILQGMECCMYRVHWVFTSNVIFYFVARFNIWVNAKNAFLQNNQSFFIHVYVCENICIICCAVRKVTLKVIFVFGQ